MATDLDGDEIFYVFDWGDGNSSVFGPYESDLLVEANYTWMEKGTYEVKVKAIDEFGGECDWSDPLSVSMPKNKPYINTPFLQFLQNHPLIYQLFQLFLRL